ncbi:hypothetical protein [Natrinema amylolyticum]|uniref:hypothetical protein n=1 Tax=Natrinema amylolyticum TaxID=2878679 RepID=UPI001CF98214|nr:hypothetical protein [Natrinema amylolyticum]
MKENNGESSEPTRRNTLRLLTGSGLGIIGVASGTAAADKTGNQQTDEELTLAEGTSGYVTSGEETPDWFTLKSAGDAKWNIGDFNKKQDNEVGLYDHLSCSGDQLDWGGSVEKWGVEFKLHLDHCAGTCNWNFQVEALGQSYSTGMNDECNGKETLSGGVRPLQIEASVRAYGKDSLTGPIESWGIELSVEYYDLRSGWETASWDFEIENPAV